jgi:hypothetical protein
MNQATRPFFFGVQKPQKFARENLFQQFRAMIRFGDYRAKLFEASEVYTSRCGIAAPPLSFPD